jgi:hypothetical protein
VDGTSPLLLIAWPEAGGFAVGDSAFVFSDGDPDATSDDAWLQGVVDQVNSSSDNCTPAGRPEVQLRFTGLEPAGSVPGVRRGAVIRSYDVVRYAITTYASRPHLGRSLNGGTMEPILGPLAASDGISFDYLDGAGNAVADRLLVRAIRVTLRTESGIRDQAGRPVADSLTFVVQARN